jgi:outer membrane immunogenic protein
VGLGASAARLSPRALAGSPGRLDASPVEHTFAASANYSVDPKYSFDVTERAGYLVDPKTLLYVRGGYTNARVRGDGRERNRH